MVKEDIISFFDARAPQWDAKMVRNEAVIQKILDYGGIRAGIDVLDVGCGTGVLFRDYLTRGVCSVTAVDISPEMVKIAAAKFPEESIRVLCGDMETLELLRRFDAAMVYNAFPHFLDPERLINVLAHHLKPGGRLSIAHGMSRAEVNAHHTGCARLVSVGLMPAPLLAQRMAPYFDVDVLISDETMYQISGVKRKQTE